LSAKQENFGFLIADVARLMRRHFIAELGECPITISEARALANVARNPGVRQVDLADLLEIQPIQLARVIDRLAEQKLVERRPVQGDRRAYHIHLLPAADKVLDYFEKVGSVIRKTAVSGLSKEQIETLVLCLNHMRDNLNSR
jgi:DNA-binding MarR family transcriptional regulator